ncbi:MULTISPECIES: patatin-like phospholipase family protein [unclassified Pseudomonas]|uniref:patatin-like phospholipase family protein n=1 Tax=unclassified Pseudomonas TaxID=196821 RepID=UPI001480F60D|nr:MULTISPECIES: patatin-like phospholipase family protein [unclassified Pseudomonas]
MTSSTEDAVKMREAPFTSGGVNVEVFEKGAANEPLTKSPVFLALQGGGAKGIVHIGGIAALEELNFDIRAVSGTSAGSMVAALIAAGFSSKELVDPDGKKHFFGTKLFGKEKGQLKYSKPTHLFTRRGWFTIKSAVLLGKALKIFWPWPGDSKVETIANCIWLTIIAAWISLGFYKTWPMPVWPLVFTGIGVVVFFIWALVGLTTVRKVRNFIDAAIAFKLKENGKTRKDKNITFRDMHSAGCIPLKIIATNKSSERLEYFSYSRTPRVRVADAVAASICLPIIFRHWKFNFLRHTPTGVEKVYGKFLDGGLVSNLPAWAFDEERLRQADATTVAFSLESPAPKDKMHWLLSIANTVVNGSGEIHTRATGSVATVALPTTLDLLAFDVSAEEVYAEVDRAKVKALKDVGNELIHAPNALSKGAKDIHAIFEQILNEKGRSFAKEFSRFRLRVALGAQIGYSTSDVTFVFDHGYEPSDPDRYATVPLRGSYAGTAWSQKAAHATVKPLTEPLMGDAWSAMRWMVCIPSYPKDKECSANRYGEQIIQGTRDKIRPCIIKIDCDMQIRESRSAYDNFLDFLTEAQRAVHDYSNDVGIADYVQGQNKWK